MFFGLSVARPFLHWDARCSRSRKQCSFTFANILLVFVDLQTKKHEISFSFKFHSIHATCMQQSTALVVCNDDCIRFRRFAVRERYRPLQCYTIDRLRVVLISISLDYLLLQKCMPCLPRKQRVYHLAVVFRVNEYFVRGNQSCNMIYPFITFLSVCKIGYSVVFLQLRNSLAFACPFMPSVLPILAIQWIQFGKR